MPINFSSLGGSSSSTQGSTDFTITTGNYSNNTMVLSRDYAIGSYGLTFSPEDSSFDVYLLNSAGSVVGYSNSGFITATESFKKITVIGSAANTSINFTYNGESQEAAENTPASVEHAQITSVVTSSLPSVDDTTVVNGKYFAADVQVSFIDQNAVETAAKSIVRSSSTQLIITRPDAFSTDGSPYTIKAVNPSLTSPAPTGTNPHLLSNSVTAGTNPVWTTEANIYLGLDEVVNLTLLATDTEATDIDYSVVSGTLPTGLSLDGETGVITGTLSYGAEAEVLATIRAVDTGGNFLDREFSFAINSAPAWTTAAGALDSMPGQGIAYSFQLVASTGSVGGALTYTLQSGALLAGHSLSSTGLISGTSTGVLDDSETFTIRVTDEGGFFADRSFTTIISSPVGDIENSNRFTLVSGTNSVTFSDFNNNGANGIFDHGSVAITGDNYWKLLKLSPTTLIGQNVRLLFKTVVLSASPGPGELADQTYNADVQIALFENASLGIKSFQGGTMHGFQKADTFTSGSSSSQPSSWADITNANTPASGFWGSMTTDSTGGLTGSSDTGRLVPPETAGIGGSNGLNFLYSESSSPVVFGDTIWGRSHPFQNDGSPVYLLVGTDAASAASFTVSIVAA